MSGDSILAEWALVRKLTSLNIQTHAFDGDTTTLQRRDILRRAVLNNNVQDVVFTVKDGRQFFLKDQFLRAYGEPLEALDALGAV